MRVGITRWTLPAKNGMRTRGASCLPDLFEIGIISRSAKERQNYPTQKPEALIERDYQSLKQRGFYRVGLLRRQRHYRCRRRKTGETLDCVRHQQRRDTHNNETDTDTAGQHGRNTMKIAPVKGRAMLQWVGNGRWIESTTIPRNWLRHTTSTPPHTTNV